ncbi:hypothetical protein, partial [Paraburkholderia mimosarum]|uniref:hypothetical protein n=1 Tax=Paraburkholderia mimosarum TaxID=312026 RepID=UPI001C3F32E0
SQAADARPMSPVTPPRLRGGVTLIAFLQRVSGSRRKSLSARQTATSVSSAPSLMHGYPAALSK